jgi:hypothetical protein
MRKWILTALLTLPLAVAGGLLYARSATQAETPGQLSEPRYVCPITGEELPCPDCCPLNQTKTAPKAAAEPSSAADGCCPECCGESSSAVGRLKVAAKATAKNADCPPCPECP